MAGPIGFGVAAAMTIKAVTCPHCHVTMARARAVAGKVTCRSCRRTFEIPGKPPAGEARRGRARPRGDR